MNKPLRVLLPIAVVAVAIMGTIALVRTKPEAKKTEKQELGAIVETIEAEAREQRIDVTAFGTVVPAHRVALAPEIGGRVRWVAKNLIPGSRVLEGEKLVRLDGKDYTLAVQQQLAAVDRARTALEVEHSRKKIAEREWEMFNKNKSQPGEPDPLALRAPQVRTATVAVKSAQSGLRRAKLAASKTMLVAPFNAVVQQKAVDVGQMVGPGTPLVTLVGTDAYYVQVSVPVSRLSWFDIPGVAGAKVGAKVTITQQSGSQVVTRTGSVLRLLGDVDPAGRMARLLVLVRDPLGLAESAPVGGAETPPKDSGMPLLLGTYVNVSIDGRSTDRVISLPREALRDNDTVYLMTRDNTLAIGKVDVLWRHKDTVLIAGGLDDKALVIVSPVPSAVEGMKLRRQGGAAKPAPARADTGAAADGATTLAKPGAGSQPAAKTAETAQ